ncbi:hypothetical protein, partial [Ramlibacter alkalitolerans]
PVPPAVAALAQRLAARARGGALAVLFYGSALRDDALDGVLDFYVLVERADDWPQSRTAAWANRILPPNVGYLEDPGAAASANRRLRAKYAVMTLAQFRRAMSVRRIDTTLWARFSQPCACVQARHAAAFEAVREAICDAIVTAAHWAAALGPPAADAASYWRALYQRTYAAELRVESSARAVDLVGRDAARFTRLLPLAWRAAGIAFSAAEDRMVPLVGAAERAEAETRWQRRRRLGRPLNLLRLLKAALTFENATDYVAWKVERHSGLRIEPTAFQRRHPLLAAPALYWRLRRLGVLR